MSDNTIKAALRTLGFGTDEMTEQRFRAMARTVIGEQIPGVDPEVIEAQLAPTKWKRTARPTTAPSICSCDAS